MNIIDVLEEFKHNHNSIDLQALKSLFTLKSLQQLNLIEFGNVISQIIATLFDEGDTLELVSISIYMAKNSTPLISNLTLNTLTVLLFNSGLIDLSKKIAKLNLKYYINDKPQLFIISHLNLAKIQYYQSNYIKCFRLVERALINYEPYIFKEMKNNSLALQKNYSDLVLLLNGYLFYAKCVQQLQKKQEMMDTDFNKFYYNGFKICKKYLPSTHHLNTYFNFQRSASISRKSLSIKQKIITIKINTTKRISTQCNMFIKFIKQQNKQQNQSQPQETLPLSQPDVTKVEYFDSGAKSSDRITQFRQFRLHSPKQPPLDIQNIIQNKFDTFVQTFSNKKQIPKINALEKRIQELQKENLRILQYKMEKEQEITSLKNKIEELSNEITNIKLSNQNQLNIVHDRISFGNTLPQNFEQQQKTQFLPPPKQINRQSTTEIKTLIQTLSQGQVEEIKVLKIPDINLSSSYNDEQEIVLIDQFDQGREYSIQLQNDMIIIKKIMIDNCLSEIQCMMSGNQLKIIFEDNKYEMIDMNMLNNFLQVAEFKIALPYNCPLKCLSTFQKFIEFCILPFIMILDSTVKLQHIPIGLFQQAEKLLFFEEECQINLIPVNMDCFRLLIITQQQQGWFDIQFDQSSFEIFFDQYNNDEFEKEAVQFIVDHLNQKEQSQSQFNKKSIFYVTSFVMKNQQQFLVFFDQLKQNIENELSSLLEIEDLTGFLNVLNGEQISLQQNNAVIPKLCLLKITEKATKMRFILIADNPNDSCFEILLQNFNETYAPRNQKVKANGYDQLEYDQINKIFGLVVTLLDYSDIQLISYYLSQLFDLYTFNKELEIEDYDRYKENCLIQNNIQCECSTKFFLASEYRIPITIQYVGINDKPIGVIVKVYDEIGINENGMFFTISQGVWDKIKKEPIATLQKKRKPPKYIACNKMSCDYHLAQILQIVGWQVIFENVSINLDNVQVCRIINENKTTFVDRLENIFNIFIKN